MINYVDGDLIKLAREGSFDVITHGCNCLCQMGAGIAPQMANEFGCNDFKMEGPEYRGDINKLGTIDYRILWYEDSMRWTQYPDEGGEWATHCLAVVNSYTQFKYGSNHTDGVSKPLDYEALTLCMRKINHQFKGKHIGMPKIGAGLAGGDWNRIETIIKHELKDMKVTVVNYKQ
jgi:O-acetyl-ADP-ribose deacetylase (regulator of RNase III)